MERHVSAGVDAGDVEVSLMDSVSPGTSNNNNSHQADANDDTAVHIAIAPEQHQPDQTKASRKGGNGREQRQQQPNPFDDFDEITVHSTMPRQVLLNSNSVEMVDISTPDSRRRSSGDGLLRSRGGGAGGGMELGEEEEEEDDDEEMGDEGVPVDVLEADLPGNHQAHHRPKFKLNLQLLDFTRIKRWRNNRPVKRWIFLKLLPVAIVFMLSVIGSSSVHFREASTIDGELYALTSELPVLWPLDDSHYMAELRIQIPSLAGEMGHHKIGSNSRRRSSDGRGAAAGVVGSWAGSSRRGYQRAKRHADAVVYREGSIVQAPMMERMRSHAERGGQGNADGSATEERRDHGGLHITVWLFKMWPGSSPVGDAGGWDTAGYNRTWASLNGSAVSKQMLMQYHVLEEERSRLLDIRLDAEPRDMLLVISTDSLKPLPVALDLVSLGVLGPAQVGCAAVIMIIVFGLIMTEVIHRTMAAMIGATMALYFLALQNRVPSLSTVVGWMDHGTLGLLWGMMLIVGITMRTGVFEWLGVVACRLSGGNKFVLCFLLSFVTGVLSAFLDNVTTILLITPVTIKLCKLVDIDPRPFLVCEAIFSNLMGTATMIGDPPNIIVGNLLSDYLTFTDFLTNLGPGVLIACPFAFFYLTWYYGDGLRGSMNADIANLQKSYPITNKPLLVKCSTVLACVVLSFFLHAVTHLDPAWIAIMGAVWLLVAFDKHRCHEALKDVEWDTLLFFAALFVLVEALGELGLLRAIATSLSRVITQAPVESRQYDAICLILWVSALFSAFVDNIPLTATMVPVIVQLVNQVEGLSIKPLAWALVFGACFGGNGTLIGASANIVMASKAESEGFQITFKQFFRVAFPQMIMSVVIANIYLVVCNAAVWQRQVLP